MACWRYFALGAILVLAVNAEEKLRLCATPLILEGSCNTLERGNSPIKCHRVADTADCAIQLAEGRADFGVFTADEVLLTHHFYPSGVQVVAELKNKDRIFESFEFQSVVVVPKSYTPTEGGFSNLMGSGFCHPGFSKSQWWHDRILKYFEQKIMNNVCRIEMTVAENEIVNLKNFFKKGCRPGSWASDDAFSEELKKKYPELCELCDNKENCSYARKDHHGHFGALDCLTSGRGRVAYASLQYVKDYFAPNQNNKKMADYQYLCPNGSVVPLESANPCAWYKQPWKVILAREENGIATKVSEKLEETSNIATYGPISWEQSLKTILFSQDSPFIYNNYTSPAHYLSRAMENVELPRSECGKEIRWCTVSELETNKCNWTSAVARTFGIAPNIDCIPSQNVFDCFDKIAKNEADVINSDTNYGHLARKVYDLRPILFSETTEEQNSIVLAVIRESAQSNRISSLAEIKNRNVCFPEYGGIAWLSFINVAREHRILSDSCKYPQIMANLVNSACTPGFSQANHFQSKMKPQLKSDNLERLCDLCPIQSNGERCEASPENAFYGDKGSLDCLKSGSGDIAFLEIGNLQAFINNGSINENEYRVLCKNGSLADRTGFKVEPECAFSVTTDSEVLTRRERKETDRLDTIHALLKLDDWLGYRAGVERRTLLIYERFNGTENLMFKSSSVGLVPVDSNVQGVQNLRELFKHVDECSGAASFVAMFTLVFLNFLIARHI